MRVSTYISGVLKDIAGKMVIFQLNLGMWPLKSIVLGKRNIVLRVSTHISGVSQEIDGKMFTFRVNLGMWPLKSIVPAKHWHVTPQIDLLGKMSIVLRVSTHISGVSQEIYGKMLTFSVNLGMWPLRLIVSTNWALFWGFQHTFIGFLRR